MKSKLKLTLVAASLVAVSLPAHAEGDPEKGAKVYRKCQACHVYDKEQNRVGPHLVGIIGREAASVESYKRYSKAAKEQAPETGTWEEDELFEYLANPTEYLGGRSTMTFRLPDEQERRDVIAFLKENAAAE